MTEGLSIALGATQYSLLTKALDGLSTVWPPSSFTSPLAVSPWRVYTKPGELNTVLYTVSDFHASTDLKKKLSPSTSTFRLSKRESIHP